MRVDILGVGFDNFTMDEALVRGRALLDLPGAHYVVTPNPEIVELCRENDAARAAVNGADLVLPDGIGVIHGAKLLHTPLRERVPGVEFGERMIALCAQEGKSVFLLGAKPGVADAAGQRLREKYPGLRIAGTHDGYFSDDAAVAALIRACGAELVLVCLGAPKQELWMQTWGQATGARLLLGLGGSMDVYAGTAQRAPAFFRDHGLEWFYRLVKNPSRLGRMMKLPLFLIHVMGERR